MRSKIGGGQPPLPKGGAPLGAGGIVTATDYCGNLRSKLGAAVAELGRMTTADGCIPPPTGRGRGGVTQGEAIRWGWG